MKLATPAKEHEAALYGEAELQLIESDDPFESGQADPVLSRHSLERQRMSA